MEKIGGGATIDAMMAPAEVLTRDRYLHWDKLRHLEPPTGLSSEQWWLKTKLARSDELRRLPLTDPEGYAFGYTLPDIVLRRLHRIDQRCAGEVAMDEVVTSEREAGNRFLVNSLMEEAIRSSQLEGATTSRVVAKELLRSGREPKDRSERMIANNYRALQFMREEISEGLDLDSILELHRILTERTLDDPSGAGRLQQPGEPRVAVFEGEKRIHVPPPAAQLPERMRLLCEFANEGDGGDQFVHPVVRAIVLHFWLAYDHPFADGNGRTARILFFWAMHRAGYWLAEYLPISRLIRNAPAQYGRAFLETETDGGDTTYFLLHQLGLIERSIEDLHLYLQRKIAEQRNVERALDAVEGLNGRQLVLLTHAVKHPDHVYTFGGHARSHRVTHETARADLGGLAKRGLLARRRRGRAYRFEPAPDLPQRLRESTA
ncbi:MAG TPA: Fic family protein [Solirubrobacterales bacterium]|nr:Fic family protein [Solirubrobacterales bacterium]